MTVPSADRTGMVRSHFRGGNAMHFALLGQTLRVCVTAALPDMKPFLKPGIWKLEASGIWNVARLQNG